MTKMFSMEGEGCAVLAVYLCADKAFRTETSPINVHPHRFVQAIKKVQLLSPPIGRRVYELQKEKSMLSCPRAAHQEFSIFFNYSRILRQMTRGLPGNSPS
jgi:hypothetical protein